MQKIFLIILTLIVLPCSAETMITGGVSYNVDSAREELSKTPAIKLNTQLISENIVDKNYQENIRQSYLGNLSLQDRTLAFFSDESYAVLYNQDKFHVFYYDKTGHLTHIEERNGLNYPYKSYKYTISGALINMGLRVSKEETFIYNPQGKLIAHWLGKYAYDENNNVIMTRKYTH